MQLRFRGDQRSRVAASQRSLMTFHSCLRGQFLLFTVVALFSVVISVETINSGAPKAITDLKEAIIKGLGFQSDDLKVSGFDIRDALVGQSIAYKFDIEVGNQKYPFMLMESVKRWEHADLPIFHMEEYPQQNGLAKRSGSGDIVLPVLSPFQLQGPMELWIQDGHDLRVSIPHDVDAGIVKKVILAEGTTVTVKGAKSVSLIHPLDLPLPLNQSHSDVNFAFGIAALADQLRLTSVTQQKPLLCLRIVGPTALASPSSSSSRLKLKRLAPGLVELSKTNSTLPAVMGEDAGSTIFTPNVFSSIWPLASMNGTNPNLLGVEKLLYSILGEMAKRPGSFRLTKADASAQMTIKMGFKVERHIKEGEMDWSKFPGWKTRPETVRMHFEVIGKLEGNKVVPERVVEIPDPAQSEDSFAHGLLTGNMTMSTLPLIQPPPIYFTL